MPKANGHVRNKMKNGAASQAQNQMYIHQTNDEDLCIYIYCIRI